MIVSFKHKGLKRFYEKGDISKIQPKHKEKRRLSLGVLDSAREVQYLNFPGSNLHSLKGKLSDHWSITVNGNWRLIFKFEKGDVYILDYVDYRGKNNDNV